MDGHFGHRFTGFPVYHLTTLVLSEAWHFLSVDTVTCLWCRQMAGIQPLTLIAQFDDLVRCRSTLTTGIESGMYFILAIVIDTDICRALCFCYINSVTTVVMERP